MSQTEAWNIVNRTGFAPLEIRVCLKQSNVLYIDEDVLQLSRFECVLNLKWFRSTTRIPAQELVFTISCLLVVTRVNTSLRCKLENNNKVTVLSQGYRCIH